MLHYFSSLFSSISSREQSNDHLSYDHEHEHDDAKSTRIIPPHSYQPSIHHDSNDRADATWRFPVRTTAYPSVGGIVIGYFYGVEIDYLGLSREEKEVRSPNPGHEDDFAVRMLHIGAQWWQSWRLYTYHWERLRRSYPYDFHFPPDVNVAYPSTGGVWVLRFSADRQTWPEEDWRKPYLPQAPDSWEKAVDKASTMDERCEVLKTFGATFYASLADCPHISKTIQEAYEKGKHHEALMKRLGNVDYISSWLDDPAFDPPDFPTQ